MRDDGRREYYGRGPEEAHRRMEEAPTRRGGLFAGNRSLLIIFIDVMVILVIYGIYITFLAGPTSTRTIDGYRFTFSASRLEATALATLRITARDEAATEDPIVTVRFRDVTADDGGGGDDGATVKDVLPERDGQERVFRRRIAVGEGQELIKVDVEALGESFTLEASVGD
ncbi:MAG: hypothetical protein R6W94_00765 [Spirochaetia bacterium]